MNRNDMNEKIKMILFKSDDVIKAAFVFCHCFWREPFSSLLKGKKLDYFSSSYSVFYK